MVSSDQRFVTVSERCREELQQTEPPDSERLMPALAVAGNSTWLLDLERSPAAARRVSYLWSELDFRRTYSELNVDERCL